MDKQTALERARNERINGDIDRDGLSDFANAIKHYERAMDHYEQAVKDAKAEGRREAMGLVRDMKAYIEVGDTCEDCKVERAGVCSELHHCKREENLITRAESFERGE